MAGSNFVEHKTSESDSPTLESQFKLFHGLSRARSKTDLKARLKQLDGLSRLLRTESKKICAAIESDFGQRHHIDTQVTDILPTVDSIRFIKKNLADWMQPERRRLDAVTFPLAKAELRPEPLGVVGVIAPWNFPLQLALIPAAYALAAGNLVIIKMSENSMHLARLLRELFSQMPELSDVAIFEETGDIGLQMTKLKFDHLIFTGSTETGRKVMQACAANLVPVTLELGGKSPAIVAPDFSIETAVERIIPSKLLNAGQICVAVDHVFVPKGKSDEFRLKAQAFVRSKFKTVAESPMTTIISERSFQRLLGMIEDAESKGSEVVSLVNGPSHDPSSRKLAPHLVLNPSPGSMVMTQEIFGPILPVIEYSSLDELLVQLSQGEKPLALYPFTRNRDSLEKILSRVQSGGVTVNDTLLHVAAHDLPFGGVGQSGMGHYHGREGFELFSKLRPVLHQGPLSFSSRLTAPYGEAIQKLVELALRRG